MGVSKIFFKASKQYLWSMLYDLVPESPADIAHFLLVIGTILYIAGMSDITKRVSYLALGLKVSWFILGQLVMMPVYFGYHLMMAAYNSTIEWMMENDTSPFDTGPTADSVDGATSPSSIFLWLLIGINIFHMWFSIKNRYHTCTTATATSPPQKAQVAPLKRQKNKSGKKHPEDAKDSDHADGSDDDAGSSTSPDRSRKTPASATTAAQTSERPLSQDESSDQEEDDAQPHSRKDLSSIRKEFTRLTGESLIRWLPRCRDHGGDSIDVNGREARQLGNVAQEGGIDRPIGEKEKKISILSRFLSAVKGRYPFRDDIDCRPPKWTVLSQGIDYLLELAMKEVLYGDWDVNVSPEQVLATESLIKKFVRSAPQEYAHILSTILWDKPGDNRASTIEQVCNRIRQYDDSVNHQFAIIAAVREMMKELADSMNEIKQGKFWLSQDTIGI